MQLERSRGRRRLMLLAVVAVVAVVAAACLPPPPPPPPPTTTTTTTTTTKPPPPAICGISASSVDAPASDPTTQRNASAGRYAAVVEKEGRSEVLTRNVSSPAEIAQFQADAAAQGEVIAFAPDGEVQATAEVPTWGFVDSKFTAAWDEATPDPTNGTDVRVAELDTGIDTAHPELTGHFDVEPGADIVTATAPTLLKPPQPALDPPPADADDPSSSGHGTHVAGIIAATAGNGVGVAGGAPGVTLVPVRVLNSSGSGSYADVAAGILWAADVTKGNAAGDHDEPRRERRPTTRSPPRSTSVLDPTNPNYTHPVITVAAGNSSCSGTQFPASLGATPTRRCSRCRRCARWALTGSCPSKTPWPADGAYKLATYSSLAWNGTGITVRHRRAGYRDQLDPPRWRVRAQ